MPVIGRGGSKDGERERGWGDGKGWILRGKVIWKGGEGEIGGGGS